MAADVFPEPLSLVLVFGEKGHLPLFGARTLEGLTLAVDPRKKKVVLHVRYSLHERRLDLLVLPSAELGGSIRP